MPGSARFGEARSEEQNAPTLHSFNPPGQHPHNWPVNNKVIPPARFSLIPLWGAPVIGAMLGVRLQSEGQ